jgi:hypothetical protein
LSLRACDQDDHAAPEHEVKGGNHQKPGVAAWTTVLPTAIRYAANPMVHDVLPSPLVGLESDQNPVLGHAQASLIGRSRTISEM